MLLVMCGMGMTQTPTLSFPYDSMKINTFLLWNADSLNFQWYWSGSLDTFTLQISTSSSFSTGATFGFQIVNKQQHIIGDLDSQKVQIISNDNPIGNTLQEGSTYYWHVKVGTYPDTFSWSSTWTFSILSPVQLQTPSSGTQQSLTVFNSSGIELGWLRFPGATYYALTIDTSSTISYSPYGSSFPVNIRTVSTDTIINNLPQDWMPSTTYYWQATAYNDSGQISNASNVWNFTITNSTSTFAKVHSSFIPLTCNAQNGIIHYSVPSQTTVFISLYDICGKQVFNSSVITPPGEYQLLLKNILPAGSYIVRFKTNAFEKNIVAAFIQ
jgi:hypothetical protein